MKKILTYIVVVVLVLFIGYCGFTLLTASRQRTQAKEIDQSITQLISKTEKEITEVNEKENESSEEWSLSFTADSWDTLHRQNPDFLAYLCWEDYSIMQPVVQECAIGEYLTKNFYGGSAGFGTAYVALDNTFNDQNTLIYAHNVIGDSTLMFSPIANMMTSNTIADNRYFTLYLANTIQQYECIYAITTDAQYNSAFTSYSINEANISSYISSMADSIIHNGDVSTTDKLITLVTCTSEDTEDTNRYVIVARMTSEEAYQ